MISLRHVLIETLNNKYLTLLKSVTKTENIFVIDLYNNSRFLGKNKFNDVSHLSDYGVHIFSTIDTEEIKNYFKNNFAINLLKAQHPVSFCYN